MRTSERRPGQRGNRELRRCFVCRSPLSVPAAEGPQEIHCAQCGELHLAFVEDGRMWIDGLTEDQKYRVAALVARALVLILALTVTSVLVAMCINR
jgi:hypothetical protein